MNPRICTARQLDATAGDGLLRSAGSPGRLETSLYSSYPRRPPDSYLGGLHLLDAMLRIACSRSTPPTWSSLAKERTPCLAPPQLGGARTKDGLITEESSLRSAWRSARTR